MKTILDHSTFTHKQINQSLIAQQISADISTKVAKYKEILAQSTRAIASLYAELGTGSQTGLESVSCCDIPPQQLKFSSTLSVAVNQARVLNLHFEN